jgi:hypothetical protein
MNNGHYSILLYSFDTLSTSFCSITLAPGFYQWGYAWPLHHSESNVHFIWKHFG